MSDVERFCRIRVKKESISYPILLRYTSDFLADVFKMWVLSKDCHLLARMSNTVMWTDVSLVVNLCLVSTRTFSSRTACLLHCVRLDWSLWSTVGTLIVHNNYSRILIQWNVILCAKPHTYISYTVYKLIHSSCCNTSGASLAMSASSCKLEAVCLAQLVRQFFFSGRNVSEDVCSVPPLSLESWPILWSHIRWLSRYSDRNGYSRGDQTCGRSGQSVSW
jgi:hypothetical protein